MRFKFSRIALCALASLSGFVAAARPRALADAEGGSYSYAIAIGEDGHAAIRSVTLLPPDAVPQLVCELGGLAPTASGSASARSNHQMEWTDEGCRAEVEEEFDTVQQLDRYLRQAHSGSARATGCGFELTLSLQFDQRSPTLRNEARVVMPNLASKSLGSETSQPNELVWRYDRTSLAESGAIAVTATGGPDQCLWAVAWKNSPGHKIGHAFVIFEKSGKREAWGFYSTDVQPADYPRFYVFEDSFHGEIRSEKTLFPQFEKKMQGQAADGLFAFRVYGVSRDQFDKAQAVLKRWQDKTVNHAYSINCMCGTFVQSVFSAAGIPIGGPNPEDNRPTALYDQFTH